MQECRPWLQEHITVSHAVALPDIAVDAVLEALPINDHISVPVCDNRIPIRMFTPASVHEDREEDWVTV